MKNFNPSRYGDFTRGEVIFIIQLSAALQTIEEIQDKFYQFTNKQKRITGSQVIEIQADFSNFIAKKSEIYLKNIDGNPLSHYRVLFDLVQEVYKECRKDIPSHSVKTSDNTYELITKQDLKTALAALKLAKDLKIDIEKLTLEKEKNKPAVPETMDTSWELDSGLNLS